MDVELVISGFPFWIFCSHLRNPSGCVRTKITIDDSEPSIILTLLRVQLNDSIHISRTSDKNGRFFMNVRLPFKIVRIWRHTHTHTR